MSLALGYYDDDADDKMAVLDILWNEKKPGLFNGAEKRQVG